nr:MFS transporter [Phytoactinopolyspora alkaliphila]
MKSVKPGCHTRTRRRSIPTHRRVLLTTIGLFIAIFMATLSGAIIVNALPRIIEDLDGTQRQYSWVFAAPLVTATVATTVWGRLADRTSKKRLAQASVLIFILGSILTGLAKNTEVLIGLRGIQGVGVGGLLSLVHIVMASMIPSRERGRYMGYLGVVTALAIVAGPLLGGIIVDTPVLGWRWCFWIGVPVGVVALLLLECMPPLRTPVSHTGNSVLGAILLLSSISTLLVWVTLVGDLFEWSSWPSATVAGGGIALAILAWLVERGSTDPVVPLRIIRKRTMALAITASMAVAIVTMSTLVHAAQYFQITRGYTPTQSGALVVPMMLGLMCAMFVSGHMVTRTGRWKGHLIVGTALATVGIALLGTINQATSLVHLGIYMSLLGSGLGACTQNLILVAQDSLMYRDLGAGTSIMAFFQSLGSAAGVTFLGTLLALKSEQVFADGMAAHPGTGEWIGEGEILSWIQTRPVPGPTRDLAERAYGEAIALTFHVSAGAALAAFVAVLFLPAVSLRTTVGRVEAPNE